MPGRISQTRRERQQLGNGYGSFDPDARNDVLETQEERRKRRKKLTEMDSDDLFATEDPKEKAATSAKYRDLQADADDMRANLANTSVQQLRKTLRDSGDLFQTVRDPVLASLDAKLMMTTSDTALAMARKMKLATNAFNVDEFLIRMKGILGLDRPELQDQDEDEEEDELADSQEADRTRRRQAARQGPLGNWAEIGWMAAKLNRRVHGVEFMYGPIGTAPKKRVVQNRARRTQGEEETRPQEIVSQNAAKAPKDDLMTHVRRIGKILQHVDPTGEGFNFFRLVVNPDDFGQTVENCFFVSFLLKDGNAGMRVADDGEVMIYARTPHDEDGNDIEVQKNQAVIELTMEIWEEAKRILDIQHSTIPTRTYAVPAPLAGDNWYAT